ncbi:MAG TPA: Crp/Fnr family transcriptional regulator [Anaerolineales bacterium]|nr:Crp/Fnr family transcriptional regulator [Anaerolineales bacterium]
MPDIPIPGPGHTAKLPQDELVAFLKAVPLFGGLDQESLSSLARVSREKHLSKGHILFLQDDPGDAAYLVYDGTIAISLNTPDGRELVINEMRAGDFFGELALFGGYLRSASAIARTPCGVIRIPREEFLTLLETQPRLMRHLLETIAQRLRSSGERESALAFQDAPARLARFLTQRARLDSVSGDLAKLSQEEIAQHIGVTRQTVAKILGAWRRAGWIITGRGRIMLVDQGAITKLSKEY